MFYQSYNSVKNNYFLYRTFQGMTVMSHFHKSFEMAYVLKGEVRFQAEDETFFLREGEMCLLMPNQIHSFEVGVHSRIWVAVFSGDLVETFQQKTEGKRYLHPVFRPSDTLISFLPEGTGGEFAEKRDPENSENLLSSRFLLQSFLYRVCHEFSIQKFQAVSRQNADGNTIHQIMSYISEYYAQEITLSSLARQFGLNKSYLSCLISKVTHQNFRTYLNSYRLEKAKELLLTTEKAVTEVAYECGFSNIRTFNRVFRENVGMTPREFQAGSRRDEAREFPVQSRGDETREFRDGSRGEKREPKGNEERQEWIC